MEQRILQLKRVSIHLNGHSSRSLLNNINFEVKSGESVAIVGESGSGKTMTALSILGLLPKNIELISGEIWFKDRLIAEKGQFCGTDLRGKHIAMIFQQPIVALNPVFTIGTQIMDVLKENLEQNSKSAQVRSNELLSLVGFENPERIVKLYPHQLSGGMAQRVMIALSLSCNPELIIADEPTTALDVITQLKILQLLKSLQLKFKFALLLITHNLKIVSQIADSIAIMHKGQIIEFCDTESIISNPHHEYSKALLNRVELEFVQEKKSVDVGLIT